MRHHQQFTWYQLTCNIQSYLYKHSHYSLALAHSLSVWLLLTELEIYFQITLVIFLSETCAIRFTPFTTEIWFSAWQQDIFKFENKTILSSGRDYAIDIYTEYLFSVSDFKIWGRVLILLRTLMSSSISKINVSTKGQSVNLQQTKVRLIQKKQSVNLNL